ncbi:methyl-CpG-binding domain protein 6-like isoform X2 [Amphibalanus amphitrite]|nr:methyl-CpG-binding domain protein 6-like isoform X2 [Amphibalanus amphitrite]
MQRERTNTATCRKAPGTNAVDATIMTAPAGPARPQTPLLPAPFAALSPPLSEPDVPPLAQKASGGRLSFFGRDGDVLLELSHSPAQLRERPARWVALAKKPAWPTVTVTAPLGEVHGFQAVLRSPRRWRLAGRKQTNPGRKPAGALFSGRRSRRPAGDGPPAVCPRRLGRRPCGAAPPAVTPTPAGCPARRTDRLADAVRRLSQRGAQSGPAPAPDRHPLVHGIDALLAGPERLAAPTLPTPPPRPARPDYSAVYHLTEPSAAPPSPLLLARLAGGGGALRSVTGRPRPAHAASGRCSAALDYSRTMDEPLNLSMR